MVQRAIHVVVEFLAGSDAILTTNIHHTVTLATSPPCVFARSAKELEKNVAASNDSAESTTKGEEESERPQLVSCRHAQVYG